VGEAGKIDRVVVINDDAAERGGAATIALMSAKLLNGRSIPVSYLAGTGDFDPELKAAGIDTGVLGGRHILDGSRGSAAVRGLFDPATETRLARWISDHDTPGTLYHLHNWHKVLSPSIFRPLRRVARRLVMSAHDYFLVCPNGGYFIYPQHAACELVPAGWRCIGTNCDRRHYGHKLWRVARHLTRRHLFELNGSGAVVLAVHEKMVPLLARAGIVADSIRVLRNPVMPWSGHRVTAEHNREVFFVGRLDGDKGADILARAARLCGAPLRIVGDGPLSRSIARDNPEAQLLGWRTREEITTLMQTARIVASPTRSRETFGLVALEAVMSGIPVILSHLFAIGDELAQRELGVVCHPLDERTLAACIRELMHDDDAVHQMSCRGFSEGRSLAPTAEQWCDQLVSLYRQQLDHIAARHVHAARRLSARDAAASATASRPAGPQW